MHFSEVSPRLHFLSDAAHLLAQSAPETSAFLMRRRNELLVDNDIPLSHAQRFHACSACGHILVPGKQGDTLKIETDKKALLRRKRRTTTTTTKKKEQKKEQKKKQQPSSTVSAPPPPQPQTRAMPGGISKVMTCGHCSSKTKLKLQGPSRISRGRRTAHLQQHQHQHQNQQQQSKASQEKRPAPTVTEPVKASSANANSKKRAKNRKAGLQALLDQKQHSSSSSAGFGLSFSDFLQK